MNNHEKANCPKRAAIMREALREWNAGEIDMAGLKAKYGFTRSVMSSYAARNGLECVSRLSVARVGRPGALRR